MFKKITILSYILFFYMFIFASRAEDKFMVYFIGKNGKQLNEMNVYGKSCSSILKTESQIRGYYFSPDGRYILVLSKEEIYLFDTKTQKSNLLDYLKDGNIMRAGWSPKNKHFFYLNLNYPKGWQLFMSDLEGEKKIVSAGGIERVFFDSNSNFLYIFESYKIENPEDPMENLKVKLIKVNIFNKLEKTTLEENIKWGASWIYDKVIQKLNIQRFKDKYFFSSQPADWSRESVTEKGDKIVVRRERVIYENLDDGISKVILKLPCDWLKGLPASCDVRWLPDRNHALVNFNNKIYIFDLTLLKATKIADGKGCGWYEEK